VYYGIFDGEVQQRGYMAVFEAWAIREDGQRHPVLCLETINVPIAPFDTVQQDLLQIFEAIARSRGLAPRLVFVHGIGTWNYANGAALARCRQHRQGERVEVQPADPCVWAAHRLLQPFRGELYSAFGLRMTLLAPFDPAQDQVQPENAAEAARIDALQPKTLRVTVRSAGRVVGFISEWPA